jgi:hypothetical protein
MSEVKRIAYLEKMKKRLLMTIDLYKSEFLTK